MDGEREDPPPFLKVFSCRRIFIRISHCSMCVTCGFTVLGLGAGSPHTSHWPHSSPPHLSVGCCRFAASTHFQHGPAVQRTLLSSGTHLQALCCRHHDTVRSHDRFEACAIFSIKAASQFPCNSSMADCLFYSLNVKKKK